LRGRVVRVRADAQGETELPRYRIAVMFDPLDEDARARLRAILRDRSEGPASVEASLGASPRKAARSAEGADRRQNSRRRFEREVVALSGEAPRVLLGRNLSVGGMLVEPHPELRLGARFKIAIYGSAREEPFLVDAEVVRDDGDRGFGLRFEKVDPALAARLERVVSSLPSVESLKEGESGGLGAVLSEIRAG
jgi:hypothetical protein